MNEAKPIATCHGNQPLFSTLHPAVSQGLPKESCEWRRSYGRAPRTVYLDASFVPYDADILPDDEEQMLVSRPYFHIYWTDCDIEGYKQTVKDDISEWQAALKAKSIPDWLIVVVTNDESKKAKLLHRWSVIDKVKSDFCSKFSDRCISLVDPHKLDSKSSESWSQFFQRLRSLLLQAYNRVLVKYEENMRGRREKRNEPGWNYFSYFICQEELAFMFEMLGLKEDALIQYDELDAMFDQSVENHANGKSVAWLAPMIMPCTIWAGVSLAKALDHDVRDEIKQHNASLLSFRNYLFSRQAALLFQMNKSWEVAQRAMEYLYHTLAEMRALEVEVPNGAMACWVFLSCLEVLQACEHHYDGQLDARFALHTANLWDFAHRKLQDLGHLCSLMPGLQPTSEQLSLVVDLVSGMGLGAEDSGPDQRPVDKLRESLSSPESFKKHYLEMCEQAMGTYKYIGRFRSSRMIGKEIADFYMKIMEPQKAENFLLDAVRMYQQEGWHHLADGTMTQLAQCQKQLDQPCKYLKTACHVACSHHLSSAVKDEYFQETLTTLEGISERVEMRASQIIHIDDFILDNSSVNVGQTINLSVAVTSHFPYSVHLDCIEISIVESTEKIVTEHFQQQKDKKLVSHKRQPSSTFISFDNMTNYQPIRKQVPETINCRANVERKDGGGTFYSIVCSNAHELLKRSDSTQSPKPAVTLVKGDYSISFSQKDVTFEPGVNTLSFTTEMVRDGIFQLDQMCFSLKQLDLLKPLETANVFFKVISIPPEFSLRPKHTDQFVMGIKQEAILALNAGSFSLEEQSPLSLSAQPTFSLSPADESKELCMPPLSLNSSCEISVLVSMALQPEMDSLQTTKATITVASWEKSFPIDIDFHHPFTVTHKVYTAGRQKYFQVAIKGTTASSIMLHQPKVVAPSCPDVELIFMNRPDQSLAVNTHQIASFLWQLNCNTHELSALDLSFTCSYSSSLDKSKESHQFSYSCTTQDFQTQFVLSYSVTSIEEDKACIMGESAVMDIRIKQLDGVGMPDGAKLAYTVKANGTVWAIGGKSCGVFTLKEGKHMVALDVVPMQPGFLHFPLVTLYKYAESADELISLCHEDADDSDNDSALFKSPSKPWTASQTSTSSVNSSQLSPHLVEFAPGQVYNESRTRQLDVSPCKLTADAEVVMVH